MARSDLNKRLLAAEARTARASTLRGESEAGKTKKKQQLTFTERLEAAVDELGESVDPLSVPTLDLIEAANEDDVSDVWRAMRHLPELVHTYLAVLVFPRCTPHRPAKLSASGVDLGGGTLFGSCFGFSGTPSAMLPAELKPKRVVDMMERGSNAKMIRTLTDRNLTKVELLSTCVAAGEKWSVDDVMKWVAHHSTPRFNALIDTGALITGLNNEEVARRLLAVGGPGTGLSGIEVCVFFDDDGGQWFVDRSGSAAMPLSRCGIALEQRFVFYDQCHCTGTCVTLFSIYCMTEYYANIMILYNDYCHAGTDCKHRLDAVAAVTLGKDMVFRDHVQGCWRMRGLEHGQSLVVLLVDEVVELVRGTVPLLPGASLAGVAAVAEGAEGQQLLLEGIISWLIVKALETEEVQHVQLMKQGLRDVWRRTALHELLDSSAPSESEYTEGGPLLLTRCNSTVADADSLAAAIEAAAEADAAVAKVAWQFMADEGWHDFDAEVVLAVEAMYDEFTNTASKDPSLAKRKIQIRGHEYELSFPPPMSQTNTQTGASRDVRRIDRDELEAASRFAKDVLARVTWEVDLGSGNWVPYAPAATVELEEAFSKPTAKAVSIATHGQE